ncbi:hypothetical protein F0562_008701 [Nyssa sinensis]|uniref:Protein kinase domain-containing protein n=1 Tax=Nyssa sinensis TaxID=561372 RepID=A0A5J5A977_9ASTE|nr:hypothetical protein F0562_008701 [Nyssa sinensis]
MTQEINLKSGNSVTAWIDYRNDQRKLNVFLSYSSSKPEKPLLMVNICLSDHVKEFILLGSAPIEPRNHPHNVSDSSVTLTPPIPVSDSTHKHHKRLGLGLGIAGPAFFCAVLVVFGWISIKKWREIGTQKSFKTELVTGPREFSYKELKSATKGFHSSRIIGHGAFGTVYKAFLNASGTISAVKRSKHSHEGKTEFLAELSIIACLRHKNLVQLQGWCVEKGELLLVYEFMANGSLDTVLYQEFGLGNTLKWLHRYNIAVGLASVLTYLHQECEQQVIHRDIKTSNIMLGCELQCKAWRFWIGKADGS